MATFNYTAYNKGDMTNVESGHIVADNIFEARSQLKQKGLIPTSLVALGGTEKKDEHTVRDNAIVVLPKLKLTQKIDFTTTVHALLTAGVPIIEALMFIQRENTGSKKIQQVCAELKRSIIAGSTFAASIARHPNVFDKVYIGLVKAGEDSGEMESTIGRLITLLKKQQAIKSKVIGALMYPVFLILVSITAVTILLTFVFPAFEGMFEQLGGQLPWPTVFCMQFGKFIKEYWWAMLFGIALLSAGAYYAFKIEPSRRVIDTYSLKIPILSDLLVDANLSNFLSVMQVSYDAGIPIVECLRLSALTLDNFFLRDSVSAAIMKVQQGIHLSAALRTTNAFPSLIMFLMSAGEQSGQLGDMLNHCVVQIDKRLDDVIDRMTKMIEPIMLVIMGGIVLFIALSLYMPMFNSYSMMGAN